jgi:hypothetical protein
MWKINSVRTNTLQTRRIPSIPTRRNFSNQFPEEWVKSIKKELKEVEPDQLIWKTSEVKNVAKKILLLL